MKLEMRVLFLTVVFLTVLEETTAILTYYMDDYCDGTLDVSFADQIRLKTVSYGNYPDNWSCQVTIQSSYSYKMMVYFKDIDIEQSFSCENDYLEMHDGSSRSSPDLSYQSKFCGYNYPDVVYTTSGNYLTLYFKSDSSFSGTGFDIVVTEYETGLCYSWEHQCDNGRCIDESLLCNGFNPCGDHSDCELNVAIIVGPVIGGTAFLVIIIVIIILVRRRRRYAVLAAGPVYTGVAPVATTATSSTTVNYGTTGSYAPQFGYNAPVAPYQQLPNALGKPPPYSPYKTQEMGMPAAST